MPHYTRKIKGIMGYNRNQYNLAFIIELLKRSVMSQRMVLFSMTSPHFLHLIVFLIILDIIIFSLVQS